MSNEIKVLAPEYSGQTLYMIAFNSAGQAWNGTAFATFTTTQGDFDIALSEVGSTGLFLGTIPGTAGERYIITFLRAGGSPASSDQQVQVDRGYWDGTNFGISVASVVGAVGSVTGAVGSVTGAVGSITGVTFPTNFASQNIDASGRTLLQPSQSQVTALGGVNTTGSTIAASSAEVTSILEIVEDEENGMASAAASALDAKTAAESVDGKLTTARAGYLDIINDATNGLPSIKTAVNAKASQTSVDELAEDVEGIEGGTTIPVSQTPVIDSRLWKLERKAGGLIGESSKYMQVGEAELFALDFYRDLPTNGRIDSIDAVSIKSGTGGGVTFSLATEDKAGVDKSQAKLKITAVTAGTYVLNVSVTKNASSGGGTTEADVTLVVSP